MKGKELIKLIKNRNLEEFNITFGFVDGYSTFPNHRKFTIDELADIGYSNKVIVLSGEEQD